MEPLHSRIPYAQWRLQAFRLLSVSSASSRSTFLCRRAHSSSKNENAQADQGTPTIEKNSIKPDITSNQSDAAGSKSTIPPSQLLPQSPLITNPNPGQAIRHRKKRRPTSEDISELSKNPWAVALSSPIRMCNVTGVRLPKALLSDWGLVEQPAPEPESKPTTAADSASNPEQTPQPDRTPRSEVVKGQGNGTPDKNKLWLLPVSLLQDSVVRNEKDKDRPFLKFRMLERKHHLDTITQAAKRSRSQNSVLANLLPHRLKSPLGPLTSALQKLLVWRSDMPDFVLAAKRREAAKYLKRVSDRLRRNNAPGTIWASFDIQKPYSEETLLEGVGTAGLAGQETYGQLKSGAFLVLGDGSDGNAGAVNEAPAFPELVALPGGNGKVPVFDLTRLLSQVELEELRAYHEHFQKSGAFLKPSEKSSIDVLLALWNLQSYVRKAA
ncbi:uncharacterized protein DSM5745_03336 [Aspergillus mulundensis]|uniref:Uncharacterized protein n=1 Tax=Aspergillus mulundensis TaxID=1810919 RepID=A0A3D8SKG3_9EURO|nr:hypothetical protein DSM5745_03336 [Aspergillus mulundensis]RDW86694.1 hypothetical protein DSM5745_03336 [Aspergillus mulundensis]